MTAELLRAAQEFAKKLEGDLYSRLLGAKTEGTGEPAGLSFADIQRAKRGLGQRLEKLEVWLLDLVPRWNEREEPITFRMPTKNVSLHTNHDQSLTGADYIILMHPLTYTEPGVSEDLREANIPVFDELGIREVMERWKAAAETCTCKKRPKFDHRIVMSFTHDDSCQYRIEKQGGVPEW